MKTGFKKTPALALLAVISTSIFAQEKDPIVSDEQSDDSPITETVVIHGSRKALYTEITENTEKLVSMPGALGDPLGAITALPGVITPASGDEPAVRGSSPSDNRYYVDSMPVAYIFHEFNTSIFDENIVQDFQLFSAGFGAQYSGATGAVFDIRLRDPKNQDFETRVSASLLRAGIFFESGVTENSAFYFSMRRGLIQYFIPEDDEPDEDGVRIIAPPEDSDYQFKYLANLGANNSLTISLAGANDYAEAEFSDAASFVQENPDFAGDAKLDGGFDSQIISWNKIGKAGSEFKLSLAHSTDKDEIEWGDGYFSRTITTAEIIKGHYRLPRFGSHSVTIGGERAAYEYDYSINLVLFICTDFDVDCQSGRREPIRDQDNLKANDNSVYLIDNWQVLPKVNIESGIQWNKNDYTNESFVNPRIALSWDVTHALTLSSSAGRYNRFPDVDTVLPLVGNPELESPQSDHFTLGIRQELKNDWSWSAELYYKTLDKLPLGLDESQADSERLYSNDVEGEARGIDLLVNKNLTDRWYGWMSLSYSKSERTNLRTNQTRDYTLDTPIVFNLVGNYQLNEKWNAGFRFSAKSGEATTKIIGVRPNPNFPDRYLPVYAEPFEDRLPVFSRLDLRAERDIMAFGKDGSFFIDILNAFNRENISERGLDYEKVNATGELHIEEEADLGIFPSVGISLTF